MNLTIRPVGNYALAMAVAAVFCLAPRAEAGWTGVINGAGIGWASVNVTSSTLSSNKITTPPNIVFPSASMTNAPGYYAGAPLPPGSSPATVARIKGGTNYVWKANTLGSNGDKTDNSELDQQINIPPADCASLEMDSTGFIAPDAKSGIIQVNTTGTAGTAIWLRGYEFTDPVPPQTVQDLETNVNSKLKWNILVVGPFNLNTSNCNAINIPFTIDTDPTNVYFVTDGEAKSIPLSIDCPPDVVVGCGQPVVYPSVGYVACGNVTITYNPPAGSSFPVGSNMVTVTISDTYGNTTNCMFDVIVEDTSTPVVPPLPPLKGETSVQVPTPIAYSVCDLTTNTFPGTTTDPTSYNTQGTFTVHWSFNDGNGNIVTSNQTVILHYDIPPAVPGIADAVGQCSVTVTPPVAVSGYFGNIAGTTASPLTYTTQGTNYITWTFTDPNGNTSTAMQRVIVKDTIPPVTPGLPDISFNGCSGASFTPPAPTTTDNCAGIVTGTTTTIFPITKLGTNVVTWIFSDGNGNSVTANQNVILTGLTFTGFYSPIGGTGGSCSAPFITQNQGSVLPIKFDTYCGSTLITSGPAPVVKIQSYSNNCTPGNTVVVVNAVYQNNWHYNWDTSGYAKGVYEVYVVLPDGSSQTVFVKLK